MQTVTVYCAWCRCHIRGNPRIERGQISHGICKTCESNMQADPMGFVPPARLRTPGPVCQMKEEGQ